MTALKYNWLWIIFAPLLLIGMAACDDDDGNLNDGDSDGGVVRGTTPDISDNGDDGTGTPSSTDNDDNDGPEANEIPEMVRDGLEQAFGDAEWFNDVGDIERDGDTVRFKLDRNYGEDREAFQDACNAVADVVMDTGIVDVETVEVEDEDGDVAMRAEGGSECREASN